MITSAASLTTDGLTEVPNPAFGGGRAQPKLIKRDYGFGTQPAPCTLGGQRHARANVTWGNDADHGRRAEPACRTGAAARCVRGSGAVGAHTSTLGVTLSVATPADARGAAAEGRRAWPEASRRRSTRRPPGDLILVKPGMYEEMVVMTKPVRLQGVGALSTTINVVTTPAENIQAWLDKMGNLLLSHPGLPAAEPAGDDARAVPAGDVAAVVGDEGPGVMVLAKQADRLRACLAASQRRANDAYCLHNENARRRAVASASQRRPVRAGPAAITVTTAPPRLRDGNQV